MNSNKKTAGFSLIEVLVASFILFMVISACSGIFYGAVKSKKTAEDYTLSTSFAPLLAEHIGLQIKNGDTSGNGYFLGVTYRWQAKTLKSAAVNSYTAVGMSSGGSGDVVGNAVLWQVSLSVDSKFRSDDFSFKTTTWTAI
ncbi:type IV pilus modification PilV family protein [Planctobacterium marinum]|uniref:type IV pilus modification PilV family protein n=1 Tax=Planctobacterium marinum TaxID=1631968 RepID=UPI001E4F683A|nr:prepilin-type N-terminal cleavage/methylation domain-containing protein [Planctobacterium marinum]MCC2606157.1 prepilin-type N-terminal cleavage/methylation domain-containing protein [Planctobacterium marinum]